MAGGLAACAIRPFYWGVLHALRIVPLVVAAAVFARAAPPLPLDQALKTGFEGPGHWAYTETVRTCDEKGRLKKETVVRFDPSKPYPEQYTPLRIDGKPPTAGDIEDYRRRGEKRGERLERASSDAERTEAKKAKSPADEPPTIEVGGLAALMDFEHAKLISEDETRYRYAVPLLRNGPHSLPVEKLQLTVDVSKDRPVLLRGSIRVLASFYVKLVAKIREGDMSIEWRTIDPKYPPVTVARGGQVSASVLFLRLGGSEQTTRTDFNPDFPDWHDDCFSWYFLNI